MANIKDCYEWIRTRQRHHEDMANSYVTYSHKFTSHARKAEMCKVITAILGSYEQIKWERDLAVEQLNKLGYQLGEKIES